MFSASVLIAGIIMTPTHMFWQTVKTRNTRYPMNEWTKNYKQNKTKQSETIYVFEIICVLY